VKRRREKEGEEGMRGGGDLPDQCQIASYVPASFRWVNLARRAVTCK